jgi:ribosomal protein S18 acetylase RimI-like enzyme
MGLENQHSIVYRRAEKADCEEILGMVKELAEFEKAAEMVENSANKMMEEGFGSVPAFTAFVAQAGEKLVGFALCYYRYSTWKGKVLYLEDLFVKENWRGNGVGKKLIENCLHMAREEGLPYLCLQVLDWNKKAIDFYMPFRPRFDAEWINVQIPVPKSGGVFLPQKERG